MAAFLTARAQDNESKLKELRSLRASKGEAMFTEIVALHFTLNLTLRLGLHDFLPTATPPRVLLLALDQGSVGAGAACWLEKTGGSSF